MNGRYRLTATSGATASRPLPSRTSERGAATQQGVPPASCLPPDVYRWRYRHYRVNGGGRVPTTSKRAKGSVQQTVWVGDIPALRQLIKQVEELAGYIRDKLTAADREGEPARRKKFLSDYDYMTDDDAREAKWQDHVAERKREIDAATEVVLSVEQGRWSSNLSGEPEEVLADIDDVSDVNRVRITLAGLSQLRREGYDVTLDLDKRSANAWFEAPESHFIDLAGRRLEEQFRRQRPWYWWFRASWGIWVFAVPVGIASYFVSMFLLDAGAELWAAVTGQLLFNAVVLWGSYYSARRIAVPFELVPDGGTGSGRRNLGRVATVVLWLLATIAIPLLLNLIPKD